MKAKKIKETEDEIMERLDREEREEREQKGLAETKQSQNVDEKVENVVPIDTKIQDPVEDAVPTQLKSKKEKERLRKERAKVAAKGKPSKATPTPDLAPPIEVVSEVASEVAPEVGTKKPKSGKKGGQSNAIAALRNAVQKQKEYELEVQAAAAAETARLLQIEQQAAIDLAIKEEAKKAKKERERIKIAELKKAGLYQTAAQRAAAEVAKTRLEAMLKSGVVVGLKSTDDDGADGADGGKKKKVVYGKRVVRKSETKPVVAKEVEEVVEPVLEEPVDDASEEKGWDDSEPEEDSESKDVETEEPEEEKGWDDSSEEEVEVEKVEPKPVVINIVKPAVPNVAKPTAKPSAKPKQAKTVEVIKPQTTVDKVVSEEESGSEEGSDDESTEDSDVESEDEAGLTATARLALVRKEEAAKRKEVRIAASYAARTKDDLRSPIGCILGHVDTGKTKLLDKIRQTNVQEGEAGGITQQIGATYFPIEAIEEKTKMMHNGPSGYNLPGLLMIDTPGHASFTNLRSRGSSLCNIAVLVVDIVHGLEPQTIESLNLLKMRKTPFIVALNKIDRLFDWTVNADYPTRDTLKLQKESVLGEFQDRVDKVMVEFAEQGMNACLYWDNKNMGKNVSLVPTSAVTGEGIPDLLHLLMDLTQTRMTENLMYLSELECTVLEVKVIEGLGTTIDVVLSNGVLREGDRICVCGLNGPIVTNIRALLTPQPMRELRVKSVYQHHKMVKASLGIKISAPDLDKAIAGSRLLLIGPDDDEETVMEEVMGDLTDLMDSIDKSGKGVFVQSSTLGSLEALLSFLKDMKIPVAGINIGPVHRKDIVRASVMLERCKEYAQLLAFDVPIDKDAEQLAKEMGVQIFTANIIYHLFDKYTAYMKSIEEQKRKDAMPTAVFPCILRMVPEAIFNKKSPIIIGVDVVEGCLRIGTPLCVVNKETGAVTDLGKVSTIELNHKAKTETKKGDPSVAIRIELPNYSSAAVYGRHFTQDDEIYAKLSRESIDVLKTTFRDKMGKEDWALVIKLKKILGVA